jgi:hypothetical protein
MIVSVHIPKTGGTSFRIDLQQAFGARLLLDYQDWPAEIATPDCAAHNERCRAEMLADADRIAKRYDVVHGHFVAAKYAGVFPFTALVTMVRDPFQHAVSVYEHAERDAASPHPRSLLRKQGEMTLVDFIEAFPNQQALYVGGLALQDFAMVGVAERYQQSVALFETIFGIPMPRVRERRNVNPAKRAGEYAIAPEVRRAVERSRANDIALYHHASERFAKLCLAYGV